MAYVYKKTLTIYNTFSGDEYYDLNLHDSEWSGEMLDIEKLEASNMVAISAVRYATSLKNDPDARGYQTRFGKYPQFCFDGKNAYGSCGDSSDEDLLTRFLWDNDGQFDTSPLYDFLASGDGSDESFSCDVGESPLEFNAAISEYQEVWPCSEKVEVARIDDDLVKWYSAEQKDWNSAAAEGSMEVMLKEYKKLELVSIPYFSTALEEHFRPFCLDPESLKFHLVSTQVGYASTINYEDDGDDDWDDDEE